MVAPTVRTLAWPPHRKDLSTTRSPPSLLSSLDASTLATIRQMTDDPSVLQATQKLVAEQIKLLELAAASGDALRVQKECAILDAYSRREAGVYTLHQTNILGQYLDSLTRTSMESTKTSGENMTLLSREIRSFSDRADRATRLVAFCTIGLVAVTFFLVLATVALVRVEMKKVEAQTTAVTPPTSTP